MLTSAIIALCEAAVLFRKHFTREPEATFFDISKFREDGFYLSADFLPRETAHQLAGEIEGLLATSDKTVSLDRGADRRLFGVQNLNDHCLKLSRSVELMSLAKYVQGMSVGPAVCMANSLLPTFAENQGSGGGWHRDSAIRDQFKAFLFLTDVTEDNGPFCYVQGSHSFTAVKKINKLLRINPRERRFSNMNVTSICDELGLKRVPLTVTAGSLVIANVRGIHRGMPIKTGNRLAVTNYYFNGKTPPWAQ